MLRSLLFSSLLTAATVSFAQLDTLWTRTYGGSGSDAAYSVQQTIDGGYIIAGYTESFGAGAGDVYLVKTNSSGVPLWTRTYGGSDVDYANSVQQTTDGGYIVAGNTYSFGIGTRDLYLVKTNIQGDTLWMRTYGGSGMDGAASVQETDDGGYVMAGYTDSFGAGGWDFYLVKTNTQGDTLWTHTYGGNSVDRAYSVRQTADGGYVVAGYTESFGAGGSDFFLIKMDSQGDTLWTRTYGGSNQEYAYSVQQTTDGGYIVAGYAGSLAGTYDFYLVKTDSQGDTLWTHSYEGSSSDEAWSIQQTDDGGYIVAGYTDSFGAGERDFYLVKTNSQGDTLWTRSYGGNENDHAYSVRQTTDGGYIMAGYTYSFGAGSDDFYLVKTGPDSVSAYDGPRPQPVSYDLACFPNPFNPSTTIVYDLSKARPISLRVFDLLGREVAVLKDGFVEAGTHRVMFDGSNPASGIYFARLDAGDFSQTKKLMLLK